MLDMQVSPRSGWSGKDNEKTSARGSRERAEPVMVRTTASGPE